MCRQRTRKRRQFSDKGSIERFLCQAVRAPGRLPNCGLHLETAIRRQTACFFKPKIWGICHRFARLNQGQGSIALIRSTIVDLAAARAAKGPRRISTSIDTVNGRSSRAALLVSSKRISSTIPGPFRYQCLELFYFRQNPDTGKKLAVRVTRRGAHHRATLLKAIVRDPICFGRQVLDMGTCAVW